MVASLASWLMDGFVRPVAGFIPSTVIGLVVGTFAFHYARRFIADLRDGA